MAGLDQDDDEFLDDDLDLDSNEFLELQQQALDATQRARPAGPSVPHDTFPSNVKRTATNVQGRFIPISAHPAESFESQSYDHGDFEEAVINGSRAEAANITTFVPSRAAKSQHGIDDMTQREQWRRDRFSITSHVPLISNNKPATELPHRGPSQHKPSPIVHEELLSVQGGDFKNPKGDVPLQDKVQKLLDEKRQWEAEKRLLQHDVKIAQEKLFGKSGEISILRSNNARQEREREKIVNELKQQQIEREERHRKELEAMKKEKESIATHHKFLDHEMNDNVWPIKKAGKGKGPTAGSVATPKKQRTSNLGDGFNDDELIISPSKSTGKSRDSTPKHGAKRKRDVSSESPGQPLHLSSGAGQFLPGSSTTLKAEHPLLKEGTGSDSRFEFLQLVLGHRILPGTRRTFEALATFFLPSDESVALSTLFMDQVTQGDTQKSAQDFPSAIGSIILSIWSKCLDEHYYPPIRYLIDLVKVILLNGTIETVNHLVNDVTRISQLTADINIIPRFHSLSKSRAADTNDSTSMTPSEDVEVQDCLQLLTLTAARCAADGTLVKYFWRSIRFDFISMLLRISQHVDDIIMTVKLLEPCVQEDQLNSIRPPDPTAGLTSEQHIIDRLTSMLIEIPRPIPEDNPPDPVAIVEMRLEILLLLERACDNKLSGRAFALHPQALGRVVRVMSDELTAMYVNLSGQEERSEVVNHACRIVFQVTSTYSSEIDLQEKLRSQPGGINKYLIALSRLAFSDAIYFERGIDEDVFDCAHQMLEDFVTPEEGELLRKAFVRDEK